MITFLPYPDYRKSLECLDRQRLNRQRLEAWQIYDAITNPDSIYRNTVRGPAVRMWIGWSESLAEYYDLALMVWAERGYVNEKMKPLGLYDGPRPNWLGGPVHASHRSNLLRKLPVWYGRYGWEEADDAQYVWPV